MKIIALAGFVLLSFVCAEAYSPALGAGTQEVSVRGYWDPRGAAGNEFDVSGSYGMFFSDRMLAGALAGYASYEDAVSGMFGDTRIWMLGGFFEYHIDIGMLTVPYAGFELGYASYRLYGGPTDSSFFYGPKAGMKYFLSEKVALDMALKYLIASDDIFLNKGELENRDFFVSFGVRALF